ncbi:response regulator [Fulvimonas sp. R45]|uniref:response regulator n=1 Tax=Fulvimonas sp. R45 TaxID=3045937 RepID=UPI00265E6F95|nr:response regulator [Fulvimonas sp. R45]MDO1529851.1 response regulator [Fulvimonas sp. R45]
MGAEDNSRRAVLLVEDDYLIADAMGAALDMGGWRVVGPFPGIDAARQALDEGHAADVAVLDVNLGGERVFPLIDRLLRDRVPVVLTTGYDPEAIPPAYAALPRLQKPVQARMLIGCLASLLDR